MGVGEEISFEGVLQPTQAAAPTFALRRRHAPELLSRGQGGGVRHRNQTRQKLLQDAAVLPIGGSLVALLAVDVLINADPLMSSRASAMRWFLNSTFAW
jgi:hypothetical protein